LSIKASKDPHKLFFTLLYNPHHFVSQCLPLRAFVHFSASHFVVNRTLILRIQSVVSTPFLNFFQTVAINAYNPKVQKGPSS
jgi:hypothetical protein